MANKTNWNNVIGKTMGETNKLDWFGRYPEITEQGIIVAIHDADAIPPNSTWVEWSEAEGKYIQVDGDTGGEAILRV